MCIGHYVKYLLFVSDFNETWRFLTDFEKYPNVKFRENLSTGSQVVPCGQKDTQTDSCDEANSYFSPCCEHEHAFTEN